MTLQSLTTAEFAAAVECPQPTVHGWVARGLLTPTGKRGKQNLFSADDVEKMKSYRASRPGRRKAPVVRVSEPTLAATTALALVEPKKCSTGGHRYWIMGDLDESLPAETLSFGPVELSIVRDNTPEGQSNVPAIDPNFAFDAGEAVVLANALADAENTWVWGPSGAGKTSGIRQMCALTNTPLYRVNMTADFTVADFVGGTKVVYDDDVDAALTPFVDGQLVKAMLHGGVLLIDEVTATPPGVLMALQAVLEPQGDDVHALWEQGRSHALLVNTEDGGELIHCHPRFRIIVTDNTNGQGDVTGAFSGTNVMNEAFRSRFSQWLRKGYPEKPEWVKMVAAKGRVARSDAERIVRVAIEVNKGSAMLGASRVTNQMVINPRDTLAIARLFRKFGSVKVAFNVGLINSLNPADADRQFVVDILNNLEVSS